MAEISITYDDSKKQTGYTHEELIQLSGVYGIHPMPEFFSMLALKQIEYDVFWNNEGEVSIAFCSDKIIPAITKIEILYVLIKRPDELYNAHFKLQSHAKNDGKNYGYKRLQVEIDFACKFKFRAISLYAHGNYQIKNEYTGYIVWAKYGFRMTQDDEIQKLADQLKEDRIDKEAENINALVLTKMGTAYWKYSGWSWHGEFLLKTGSKSQNIFDEYGRTMKP